MSSPEIQTKNIKLIAEKIGFDDCRIASATIAPNANRFYQWLEEGTAGDMKWLERNPHRRVDPREVLPGAQSVISLALNYYAGKHPKTDYKLASYAWNADYHYLIEEMLADLNQSMIEMGGVQRYYVDTGPVLERDFASLSGLGWNGKSTVQIHRKLGTWFFLAEIITTLNLTPDQSQRDHCGKCTACIQACPTQAITAPRKMDARRCISYLTIEHLGSIPEKLRPLIGDRLYGCDDCLSVCPWNKFAHLSKQTKLHARSEIFRYSLLDFLEFDEKKFRHVFAKSPIKRIKLNRFLRNVCVVLGNTGKKDALPALEKVKNAHDALVNEHATWAIQQIQSRTISL